ncbi:MAG: hypothetical protein WD226_03365 [Planctomycetota bacterium]
MNSIHEVAMTIQGTLQATLWRGVGLGLAALVVSGLLASQMVQETYFKATPRGGANFGYAIDADGERIVIGALNFGVGGSAFVFRRDPSGWIQEAMLQANFPDSLDVFGISVAIDGDTIAVGATHEDSWAQGIDGDASLNGGNGNGRNSGAVYVYNRSGTTWSQQTYIKSSNSTWNDKFGYSVALQGDRLFVAAIGECYDLSDPVPTVGITALGCGGAVFAFERSNSTWAETAYIRASNFADGFGISVGYDGSTLVVGAPSESVGTLGVDAPQTGPTFTDAGAAYVFSDASGTWIQEAYLKPSTERALGRFGQYLAIDGDRIAVGAYQASTPLPGLDGAQHGAATVFRKVAGLWTEEAWLLPPNFTLFLNFGSAIALSGDTLIVGAYGDNSLSSGINGDMTSIWQFPEIGGVGAAHHFEFANGAWEFRNYIKASNPGDDAWFGLRGAAIEGDKIYIGSPHEMSSSTGINGDQTLGSFPIGAVYEFDIDGPDASVESNTSGSNVASYSATAPVLGSTWQATVDLSTTGHAFAVIAFFEQPALFGPLAGNQFILVGTAFPAGELFALPPIPGPQAALSIPIPNVPALSGVEFHTQAFHFGGTPGLRFSNALHLRLGN